MSVCECGHGPKSHSASGWCFALRHERMCSCWGYREVVPPESYVHRWAIGPTGLQTHCGLRLDTEGSVITATGTDELVTCTECNAAIQFNEDHVDAVVPASKKRCPQCKMPGWNGINLKRRSYSGCTCCGYCM